MGMDLLREDGNESFSGTSWNECLKRAIEFGWTPEGTVAPVGFPGQWQGGYWSNDFQEVTTRDARRLGDALLRVVAALSKDCPDEEDELTAKRLAAELRCLRKLANYALDGGFVIA